jgi:phage gpG-like protein
MTVRAKVKVSDKDRGWKELQRRVLRLSRTGAFVRVGIQGNEASGAHTGSGQTVAEIATVHEFGAVTQTGVVIPQRSFIRAAIDENAPKLQRTATLVGRGVLLGKFGRTQALELLGHQAVGIMKQRIANRIAPRNSPVTIARKGSDVPLIDSGQLRGSITHKVEAG